MTNKKRNLKLHLREQALLTVLEAQNQALHQLFLKEVLLELLTEKQEKLKHQLLVQVEGDPREQVWCFQWDE